MHLIKSAFFFLKLIFFPVKVDYVLISLNHFNRVEGKNNFLEPIYQRLLLSKKSVLYIEDTDLKGAYQNFPRSNHAIGFDFITFCFVLLTKIGFSRFSTIKFLRKVFLRNLRYKYLINMAGYTLGFFAEMFPERIHFELQHGLVFNNREWWMQKEWNHYPNCGILLHGQGFKDVLLSNEEYIIKPSSHLLICGVDHKSIVYEPSSSSRSIIFTEQITIDNSHSEINEYIDYFCYFLNQNKKLIVQNNITIFVKEHPRIPQNLSNRYKEYAFIRSIKDINSQNLILAHLTFNSAAVFEYSIKGIPTIIIDGFDRRNPKFLFETYQMPLQEFVVNPSISLEKSMSQLFQNQIFQNKSFELKNWASNYSAPCNDEIIEAIEKR